MSESPRPVCSGAIPQEAASNWRGDARLGDLGAHAEHERSLAERLSQAEARLARYTELEAAAREAQKARDAYQAEWAKPHPEEGLPKPHRSSAELERWLIAESTANKAIRAALQALDGEESA